MIIDRIDIAKFHGFKDVGFKLGTNITIIAGQNGTQKTTLLGLLGQPFSLRLHPLMKDEKPLCGRVLLVAIQRKIQIISSEI